MFSPSLQSQKYVGMRTYKIFGFKEISGSSKKFPIDHRIFNAAVFCSTSIYSVFVIKNLFAHQNSLLESILGALSIIILGSLYYLSRIKQIRNTSLRLTYLSITSLGVVYTWIETGGLLGFAPYFIVLTYMIYLTIFRLRHHILLSIFSFSLVTCLSILQMQFPWFFIEGSAPIDGTLGNHLIALLLTMFFSLGMINFLKLNYSLEKRKVIRAYTDLAISEQNAQKAKNEAIVASNAKAEFLSTMTHEIRTPMNAVIGMTHILLQEEPRQDQIDHLNILKFSAGNLLSLINDVLDFSKIESGKIVFEKVKFNLRELVTSVRESMTALAREKSIEVILKVAPKVPDVVIGDPTRLTQILNNLVGNAVKFTKHGSVTLDVSLGKMKDKMADIKFAVIDTGIGISKDQQEKIFEKFSQASASTNREFGGTGLGLSITKKLLELQNSEIALTSKPNVGTTFKFNLSMKVYNQQSGNISNIDQNLFTTLKGLRILLADDNKMNIFIASKFLKKWDAQFTSVSDGLEALNEVSTNDYDIVLMDLQMPLMDGTEATRRIRKLDDKQKASIPIIALTASVMLSEQDAMYEAGISDFVSKPFNPSDLFRKIVEHTELRKEAA